MHFHTHARPGLAAIFLIIGTLRGSHAAIPTPLARCNQRFANALTFPIPGRGLALSWAPQGSAVAGGHAIAVGGHLIGAQTYLRSGERYDTKLFDTTTGAYLKRFGVHYWWAVSNTWTINRWIGEVIADGAGDHAVKIFNAAGAGTNLGAMQDAGARGRFALQDGALPGIKAAFGNGAPGLPNINAWILSLAFSPDGDYLAGASKDGTVRIWQITNATHPGDQFRVVKLLYDPTLGPALSVRWAPDGHTFAVGYKTGQAAIYAFDPVADRWDQDTIAAFVKVAAVGELSWLASKRTALNGVGRSLLGDVPVWLRTGLGSVWNVRYSPDGRHLAVAADKASQVFDLSSALTYPLSGEGHGLDWSPDRALLALGGKDGRVRVFNATPPFTAYDVLQAHTEPVVGAVAWSPDGATLATVAGGPLIGSAAFDDSVEGNDDTVRLWVRTDSTGVSCDGAVTTTVPTTTRPSTSSTTTTTAAASSTTAASTSTTSLRASTTTSVVTSTTTTTFPPTTTGDYPGFGHRTTGGAGHAVITVTTAQDSGAGSLRDALQRAAKAGGGIIRFALDAADIIPGPDLIVPTNTTIDATGSHITLWGGKDTYGDGVLNVWNSNVIVRGLRIRNGHNDGIQVSPKQGHDISDIVIDRCSLTRNGDGGIDITGHGSRSVSNVTVLRTLFAGNGRRAAKGPSGGGSLFKYGAFNGSFYGNYFFANLQRTPLIAGSSRVQVVVDLRYNIAAWTQSSSMSIRSGASANIVGNRFIGPDNARLWPPASAYFAGGNVDQNAGSKSVTHLTEPLPVPALPSPSLADEALDAGAQPRDLIDTCYLTLGATSYSKLLAAACAVVPTP